MLRLQALAASTCTEKTWSEAMLIRLEGPSRILDTGSEVVLILTRLVQTDTTIVPCDIPLCTVNNSLLDILSSVKLLTWNSVALSLSTLIMSWLARALCKHKVSYGTTDTIWLPSLETHAVQPRDLQLVLKDHRQVSYWRACSQSESDMNEVNEGIIDLLYNEINLF